MSAPCHHARRPCSGGRDRYDPGVSKGSVKVVPPAAAEPMLIADMALALAGYEVPKDVGDLCARIGRGEITGDEAVAEIIARHLGPEGVELLWRNKADERMAASGRFGPHQPLDL